MVWLVLKKTDGDYKCGGTLVASKYVVSAAHCMFDDEEQTIPLTTDQIDVSFSLTKFQI